MGFIIILLVTSCVDLLIWGVPKRGIKHRA